MSHKKRDKHLKKRDKHKYMYTCCTYNFVHQKAKDDICTFDFVAFSCRGSRKGITSNASGSHVNNLSARNRKLKFKNWKDNEENNGQKKNPTQNTSECHFIIKS